MFQLLCRVRIERDALWVARPLCPNCYEEQRRPLHLFKKKEEIRNWPPRLKSASVAPGRSPALVNSQLVAGSGFVSHDRGRGDNRGLPPQRVRRSSHGDSPRTSEGSTPLSTAPPPRIKYTYLQIVNVQAERCSGSSRLWTLRRAKGARDGDRSIGRGAPICRGNFLWGHFLATSFTWMPCDRCLFGV